MTATLDPTEHVSTRHRPASDDAGRQIWVQHYPDEATAVVTVRGECDELAAPRLAELLGTRLQTTLAPSSSTFPGWNSSALPHSRP